MPSILLAFNLIEPDPPPQKRVNKRRFEQLGPLSRWYDKDMKHPAARTPDMTVFFAATKIIVCGIPL